MLKRILLAATCLAAPTLAYAQSTSLTTILGPTLKYDPVAGKMDVLPGTTAGTARDAAAAITAEQAAQAAAATAQTTAQSANNVQPIGIPGTRTNADRARDRISIRDFLPAPACDGVTDDSPTLYAASISPAAFARDIEVPGDCRLALGPASRLAGHPVVLAGTGLVGESGRDYGNENGQYGQGGSSIVLNDPSAPALIVRASLSIRHLTFFWPGMTEAAAVANGGTPPSLPALIAGPGTALAKYTSAYSGATLPPAGISSIRFEDNDVLNAYDVVDFSNDGSGQFSLAGNRAFFEGAFVRLGVMPVESWIQDNDFTSNADYLALGVSSGPTHNLYNYAASKAEVIHMAGNGSAGVTETSGSVDGLVVHHNIVFGIGYFIRILGGFANGAIVTDNGLDAVPHWLSIETGGSFLGRWSGGVNDSYTSAGVTGTNSIQPNYAIPAAGVPVAPFAAFYQAPDAAPGTTLDISSMTVTFTEAGLLDFEGTGTAATASIKGVHLQAGSRGTGSGGSADAVHYNAGGRLVEQDNEISMSSNAAGAGSCTNIASPLQSLMVTGNTFVGCNNVLSYSGPFGPAAVTVALNQSYGTGPGGIYGGSLPQAVPNVMNTWDLPTQGWNITQRSSDGALIFTTSAGAEAAIAPNGTLTTTGGAIIPDLNVAGQGSVLGPWTAANLTATPQLGTLPNTTAGLSYRKLGRQVTYNVQVYFNNIGTGAGIVTLSGFPFTEDSNSYCVLSGEEVAANGKSLTIRISPNGTTATIVYSDGTAVIGTGLVLAAGGSCPTAN